MRFLIRLSLLSLAFAMLPLGTQAKGEHKDQIYAFGYSTNLNDSTLFLTAVQLLPEASLTHKDHFLSQRNAYSQQLKDFLDNKEKGRHCCAIFFAKSKKSMDKQHAKVRKHLLKIKHSSLTELSSSDFQFKALDMSLY